MTERLRIAAILLAIIFTRFITPDTFFSGLGTGISIDRLIFLSCKYLRPGALILTAGAELPAGMYMRPLSFIPHTSYSGMQEEGIVL